VTILNLALGRSQARILSDSLLVGYEEGDHTRKVIWFPHLKTAVAGCGGIGPAFFLRSKLLMGMPADTTVSDVSSSVSDYLEAVFQKGGGKPAALLLVGAVSHDRVEAFCLQSGAKFAPQRLASGFAYLWPDLAESAAVAAPAPVDDVPAPRVKTGIAQPARPSPRLWHLLAQDALAAVDIQRRQAKGPIGGPLIDTTIDSAGSCSQRVLQDLDSTSSQ
jgi:hypothetical protein